MSIIHSFAIGFKKILIVLPYISSLKINSLFVVNGNKTLNIDSSKITSKDGLLIFLKEEITIKEYCVVYINNLKTRLSYNYLFNSSEFNNKYYYNGELGLTYSNNSFCFKVWSPAASKIFLLLYKNGDINYYEKPAEVEMLEKTNGVWSVTINKNLINYFYTYKVEVYNSSNEAVDPYAKAVGVNGNRAAIIDMDSTNPLFWHNDTNPKLEYYTDAIIYEVSIRDISIHSDSNIKNKGTYLGLTEDNTYSSLKVSTGFNHIKELGITHVQLMPFFDFSSNSIDEKNPIKYNWGYDPENLNAPEGSYSLNPYDPMERIIEVKKMIQHFHNNNISVNMDVVYNHMFHKDNNNFEKIFPGYYFRLNRDGSFSNGTGCTNDTASERVMMRKFIVDSVLYWAKEYHIDGFRFDLMGIHDIKTMRSIQDKLKTIGRNIMLYGEGWNLDTPLLKPLKAIQENAHKLPNIGFFNDFTRDSIKGSIFSLMDKGFVSGKKNLEDTIKYCLTACSISYNSFKKIYSSPEQSINYVCCHDNHTLWDKLSLSNKVDSIEDKKSMLKLANAIILTSQGVPFLHSGTEFCRTKSGIENSYSSPDYINWIDYNRKFQFLDVFSYIKGLIDIRRNHPSFRINNTKDIMENLEFIEASPENCAAFILKNNSSKDSWNKILVIYNANKIQVTLKIPYGKWHIVANKFSAGLIPLSTLISDRITVDGISLTMLYLD
ncbi:pullulanase precursor [Clostridium homopropionicum DSM 5847]|uniref:Pullulanase n=1 Tax=Clostridium homopropionicum DSM 5847 TaxID=1121318 RepID=A0A0L6Z5Q0_9CLOT|nr:type I pullulanase [Clostridium homopropionicum]KOA18281.1 pullulanase precursor [Clostridium homopropionicum DSM 5847]SFF69880.1 pullulanase [Clostridium homopropionicum]